MDYKFILPKENYFINVLVIHNRKLIRILKTIFEIFLNVHRICLKMRSLVVLKIRNTSKKSKGKRFKIRSEVTRLFLSFLFCTHVFEIFI